MADFENKERIIGQKISISQLKRVIAYEKKVLCKHMSRRDVGLCAIVIAVSFCYGFFVPFIMEAISNSAQLLVKGKEVVLIVVLGLVGSKIFSEIFMQFAKLLQYKLTSKLQYYIEMDIKELIMDKMCTVKMEYFDNPDFNDKQMYINTNVANRVSVLFQVIISFTIHFFLMLPTLILLGVFKPHFIVLGFLILVCCAKINFLNKNQLYLDSFWEIPEYKKMNLAYDILTSSEYGEEKKAYNYQDYVEKMYDDSWEAVNKKRHLVIKGLIMNKCFISLLVTMATTIMLIIVGKDVFQAKQSVGAFSMLLFVLDMFFINGCCMTNSLADIFLYSKYLSHLLEINDLSDEKQCKEELDYDEDKGLVFNNVSFSYPYSNKLVLKEISFNIQKNEKVAIVGKNGSGKSTLISLLAGLYEPDQGDIVYGGKSIYGDVVQFREKVSCVFQAFNKYDMSVKDNIIVGDINRDISDEELRETCRRVGVDRFVDRMKNDFYTVLGGQGEEGINLSGGQWERVVMARALIKKRASILIMDEPTAALDPKAEDEFYRLFNEIAKDKMSIVVSHRLGITRLVDKIIVLDEGKVIEMGSFDQLMSKNGCFFEMYMSQAGWYE